MHVALTRICAAAALLGASSATSLAQEVTLRISLQLPLASHLGENLELFSNEVAALSSGTIAVEIRDSAQLYTDEEVSEAVGAGKIEMGAVSLASYGNAIAAVDVFDMPFLFNTEGKVRAAVAPGSPIRTAIDTAIGETGSKVLWWQAYGSVILLSNGAPIAAPGDLEGKTVRVFGRTLGQWVETLGGTPVLIPGSEQALAYQRGTVDVGMTGVSTVDSRSLWEVMDTITKVDIADIEFVVVINQRVWDGLGDAQRQWIEAAASAAETDVRDRMAVIEARSYAAARQHGMTVYQLSEREIAAWREASQPFIDAWLRATGDLGEALYAAAGQL